MWELRQDKHNVLSWNKSYFEKNKDKVLKLTDKTAKEMLDRLKKQCLPLKNTEKKYQLKETEFLWDLEEDTAVYFTKLHRDQEQLKKVGINWDGFAKGHTGGGRDVFKLTV